MASLQERLLDKISPEPNSGCWLWTASLDGKGYPQIQVGTRAAPKVKRGHRLVYEMYRGPIPEGLQLDHLCRVPSCVNPDLLEPVTCAENLRRGNHRRPGTHCHKGHAWSDGHLYISPKGKRHCAICAKDRSRRWARNRRA